MHNPECWFVDEETREENLLTLEHSKSGEAVYANTHSNKHFDCANYIYLIIFVIVFNVKLLIKTWKQNMTLCSGKSHPLTGFLS